MKRDDWTEFTAVRKPDPRPPGDSWWIGKTREAFSAVAKQEQARIQQSGFGRRSHLFDRELR